jgi:hypothetical protein
MILSSGDIVYADERAFKGTLSPKKFVFYFSNDFYLFCPVIDSIKLLIYQLPEPSFSLLLLFVNYYNIYSD